MDFLQKITTKIIELSSNHITLDVIVAIFMAICFMVGIFGARYT